ncbi:MAG: phosphoglycolate phosphatase [Gammaproteobacteria bacterium]|nr:phosphoglycolate phosphatase [Gammaproteobacteria bacterium]
MVPKTATPEGRLKYRPQLVLIDLDGTLVDSVPDLAMCVDQMMDRLAMPRRGEAAVRNWIGNGVERLVRRALINARDGEPDEALFRRAYPIYMELYQANVCVASRPFPGVVAGLDYLQAQGCKLGCVTNKPALFTEPLLEQLGLRHYFEIVVSGDTLPQKKPHPAPLLHAAQHFGIAPAAALMVGDSMHDVEAARAAGFQVVGVTYGYNHGHDIREAHPDAVIDALSQLRDLFEAG